MPTFRFTLDLDGSIDIAKTHPDISIALPFIDEIIQESTSLWRIVTIAMGYFGALYNGTKYEGTEEQGLIECLSSGFSDEGWGYPSSLNIGGCLPEDADLGFNGWWSITIHE